VSEKNSKKYDIAKIHEFLDSITPPQEGSTGSYVETKQKLLQKKLFDEPAPTTPPDFREGFTDNLPAWETVTQEPTRTETTDHDKNDEADLPEFEQVPTDQLASLQDDEWLSSYDLLEIEVTWATNQGRQDLNKESSEPVPFEEVPTPVIERPTELPTPEPQGHTRKYARQEQKRLRKELNQKVKRERQTYLRQEKEARRLKRLEKRERKEGSNTKTQSEENG
jgi:hypothetical protein